MIYKRFIVLLGILLGSHVPVVGQTSASQVVLTQEHGVQIMTIPQTVTVPLLTPSFLLSQDLGNFLLISAYCFPGVYQHDPGLEHFSPMDEVKTLTLAQSSLPLLQFWSGKFQLDAFQSTLRMENMQLGTSGYGGLEGFRPTRRSYPGGPFSVHFTGLSLGFHFGRDSRTRHPTQVWRRITRFVGAVLN